MHNRTNHYLVSCTYNQPITDRQVTLNNPMSFSFEDGKFNPVEIIKAMQVLGSQQLMNLLKAPVKPEAVNVVPFFLHSEEKASVIAEPGSPRAK